MMMLSGMQNSANPNQTAGMTQVSESAVRMGSEIDQALKLLAQAIPQLAPWVEKTVAELRYQIGMSLQSGNIPTDPTTMGKEEFPDGMGRL